MTTKSGQAVSVEGAHKLTFGTAIRMPEVIKPVVDDKEIKEK